MIMTPATVTPSVENRTETNAANAANMVRAPRTGRLLITVVEILLFLLLVYVAYAFIYGAFAPDQFRIGQGSAPEEQRGQPPVADNSLLREFDPFFRRMGEAPEAAAPESSLNLVIAGLRTDGAGNGSAIVNAQEGGQKLVQVGEEIIAGVILRRVFEDRIEISRRGVRETVFMVKSRAGARPAKTGPSGAAMPHEAGFSLADLLGRLNLEPVRRGGRIAGFRVGAAAESQEAQAVGFEPDDIILSVNGQLMTSFERLAELGEELAGADTFEIIIERRGAQMTLSL